MKKKLFARLRKRDFSSSTPHRDDEVIFAFCFEGERISRNLSMLRAELSKNALSYLYDDLKQLVCVAYRCAGEEKNVCIYFCFGNDLFLDIQCYYE